jgi:hypothetical protein
MLRPTMMIRPLTVVLAVATSVCGGAVGKSMSLQSPTLLGPTELTELTKLDEQTWDTLSPDGWGYLRRASAKDDDIVVDTTAPRSPKQVLRIIFTPGMRKDSEPSVHWKVLSRPKEMFATWWIKLSANWTGSPAGCCKMAFAHAAPDGQGQVYIALLESKQPHYVGVNTEWLPYGQKIWKSDSAMTPIYYNRWYRIDWHVKWSTAPQAADGLIQWWVDGTLNGSHAAIQFPAEGLGFTQFEFAPTIQVPPPTEQYMYIDHSLLRVR